MSYLEILLLGFILIYPLIDLINEKYKSKNKNTEYIKIAIFLWLPTILLIGLFYKGELSVASLSFEIRTNWQNITVGSLLLLATIYLFFLIKSIQSSEQLRTEIRNKFEGFKDILPETKSEMLIFTLVVSMSAGICEELIFRAYLFTLLDSNFGMLTGIVLSSLLFGLWHIYLGWQEVIRTSIMGGVFCGIYVFTGSIILPILAHIFIDVYSGLMCYFAMQKSEVR